MSTSYEQQHVEYPSRKRMGWLAAGAALLWPPDFLMFSDSSDTGESVISAVVGLVSVLFWTLSCIQLGEDDQEGTFICRQ